VYKKPVISGALAKKVTITDNSKRAAVAQFPFTYPSWNEIQAMHWAARKKAHDKFQKDVGVILNSLHIQPFTKPVKIMIDLYFKKKRTRDIDNYGGKWILDAIRMAGIILDDSTKWVPAGPDVLIIDDEGVDQTMLKIEEA